jgi:hypothetical protein
MPPRKPPTRESRPLPVALIRSYERYLKIVLALPGTVATPPPGSAWQRGLRVFGTPSVKAYGKFLSRWRTEAEGGLAIRCDFLDRQIMLQARPDVFFLTDHYRNYPAILVRIDKAPQGILADVVERAWRFVAPKRAVTRRDAELAANK